MEGRDAALEAALRQPRYFQTPLASFDGNVAEFFASIAFASVLAVGLIFYCLAVCRDVMEQTD
jgi:hypothetical protein